MTGALDGAPSLAATVVQAGLAGLVLSFIACFIYLLVIAPYMAMMNVDIIAAYSRGAETEVD